MTMTLWNIPRTRSILLFHSVLGDSESTSEGKKTRLHRTFLKKIQKCHENFQKFLKIFRNFSNFRNLTNFRKKVPSHAFRERASPAW